MQSMDVDGILARGKEALGVKQDAELAERLRVARPTVAAWRRRKSIPAKYLSQMLDNGKFSLDWLVNGVGEKENWNEYGLLQDHPAVDAHILWLALCKLQERLQDSGVANLQALEHHLSGEALKFIHIELDQWINRLTRSKHKWAASKLIAVDDLYDVLATEFELTFLGVPPQPWWEWDEEGPTEVD